MRRSLQKRKNTSMNMVERILIQFTISQQCLDENWLVKLGGVQTICFFLIIKPKVLKHFSHNLASAACSVIALAIFRERISVHEIVTGNIVNAAKIQPPVT